MTEGKTHEIQVARQLEFDPGTMVVMDRGYTDAHRFLALSQRNVLFVTRLKDNAEYGVVQERTVPAGSEVSHHNSWKRTSQGGHF